MTRRLTHIILHHSATEPTLRANDPEGARLWAAIQRFHQKRWRSEVPGYVCDYHFGVGPTGVILTGQPLPMVAFNCGNAPLNAVSIAICFLGDFQRAAMPRRQLDGGITLLRLLIARWSIPGVGVLLHREVPSAVTGKAGFTACPGRFFPAAVLRAALRPAGGGRPASMNA